MVTEADRDADHVAQAAPDAPTIESQTRAPNSCDQAVGPVACSSPRPGFRPLLVFLILVPVLLGLYYTHAYGVNGIYQDQRDGLLPLFLKWDAGTLRLADFWHQHNEHRHFLPRLIMFGLAFLTRWNTTAEMYFSQVLLLISLGIFLGWFRKICRTANDLWLLLPIPWLVFSWRQNENLTFGWQIGFVLAAVASVSTLMFLDWLKETGRTGLKFAAALVCATMATFSSAQGLLVWPAGLLLLLMVAPDGSRRLNRAAVWIGLGAIEWAAYFWHYVKPAIHPALAFSPEYFVTFLGASLFPVELIAQISGTLLILLVATLVWLVSKERKWNQHAFWLALIFYGLLVAGQTTLGRAGFGAEQALSSRYSSYSLLIVIGAYAILSALFLGKSSRWLSALWGGFLNLIVLGLILSLIGGAQAGGQRKERLKYQVFLLHTYETQPDELVEVSTSVRAPQIRSALDLLRKWRWNVFASPADTDRQAQPGPKLPFQPQMARGDLTQIDHSKDNGLETIAGWATDADGTDLAGGVVLEIDGRSYPACYGLRSEEAVRLLNNDRVTNSGFKRQFSARDLGKGEHHLRILVLTKDRSAFFASPPPMTFRIDE